MSQSRTVFSLPPLSACFPSRETATLAQNLCVLRSGGRPFRPVCSRGPSPRSLRRTARADRRRKGHRHDLARRVYHFRVTREHRESIGVQAADLLAAGHVPEPNRAIALGMPAARHSPLPVGRDGHAPHRACMSFQQAHGSDLLRPAVVRGGNRLGRSGRGGRRRADDLRGCRGCWRLGRFAGNSCRFCGRACRGNRSGTRIRPTASACGRRRCAQWRQFPKPEREIVAGFPRRSGARSAPAGKSVAPRRA